MEYQYIDIVHKFYEELKPLFINYLRSSFPSLNYDDIMDIYIDVWDDVRLNIQNNKVEKGTKWKAYILKIGWYKANNTVSRKPEEIHLDDSEKFNSVEYEVEVAAQRVQQSSIYSDPDLQAVLAAELSYIPDPCNKILKLYYFDDLSMKQIADTMNYSSDKTAKVTKSRCQEKLKARVLNAVKRLGILD
jgi:RNA polymerase sigma-70 factor (ECF subfamily)